MDFYCILLQHFQTVSGSVFPEVSEPMLILGFCFCFAVPCECTTEDVQDMGIYRHAYAGELSVQLWGGVVVADTFARLVHVTDIPTNCQA